MRGCRPAQNGVILLVLLLVLFMAGSTFVLSAWNNRQGIDLTQQAEVIYQLQDAKEKLLAYAANSHILSANANGPGFLPCPVADKDQATEPTCDSNPNSVKLGRLPEYVDLPSGQRYEINRSFANIDQRFWYAIGPRYSYHSSSKSNRQSYRRTSITQIQAVNYRLSLDGTDGYVAVLLAPMQALGSQNRAGDPNDPSQYLEGGNGSNGFAFTSYDGSGVDGFNDIVVGITLDEYINAVGLSVVQAMKEVLDQYYVVNGSYPDIASFTGSQNANFRNLFNNGLDWLDRNNGTGNGERWSNYSVYQRNSQDSASIMLATYVAATYRGCPGIIYTLTFGGGIEQNGNSCTL